MSYNDAFADWADAVATEYGDDITYTPISGPSIATRAAFLNRTAESALPGNIANVELRQSEVASPQIGAHIIRGSEMWVIDGVVELEPGVFTLTLKR